MRHEASLKGSKKGCLPERGSHSWVALEQQRGLMIAAAMNGSGAALASFPIAVVKCPDKSNFSEKASSGSQFGYSPSGKLRQQDREAAGRTHP